MTLRYVILPRFPLYAQNEPIQMILNVVHFKYFSRTETPADLKNRIFEYF